MNVKQGLKEGDSKDRIIASAQQCLSEKSVDKTTLSEIARRAGISKGTLYYYYPTKNDLVFDIAGIHMAQITEKVFAMMETGDEHPTWEEVLGTLFEGLLGSKTRSRLHLYLINESLSGNPALKGRLESTYGQWFQLVQDGYLRMVGGRRFPDGLARLLVAVLDGLVIQSVTCEDRLEYRKLAAVAASLVTGVGCGAVGNSGAEAV
ncbi:TetR/AcrR family transcriptional regulator [Desulfoluna spongiiphila]|uniref:TetR/AcrR family transcriptional regulator n=1 Tax=Desulfoluna spongiiphila TaxID=419481 RepID=UPI001C317ED8|nr:TetR/AcrR family transcriptional regulator [Desulfoluna spongiiphila]